MIILIGAAIAFMLIGFFGYNPLRKKFAGVIGVGGSYIILLGIMLLCAAHRADHPHRRRRSQCFHFGNCGYWRNRPAMPGVYGVCDDRPVRDHSPAGGAALCGLPDRVWVYLAAVGGHCAAYAHGKRQAGGKKRFSSQNLRSPGGCCLTWCMPGRTAPSMNAPNTGQRFVSTTRISGTAEHPLAGPGAEVRFCSKISCLYSGQQGFVGSKGWKKFQPICFARSEVTGEICEKIQNGRERLEPASAAR